MNETGTTARAYAERLAKLQHRGWKTWLDVQRPYRWNLRRLEPGRTLDVGCGIGRCLRALPRGSVGVDHNVHAIEIVRSLGLVAYLPDDFAKSADFEPGGFDTILLSHVLEHMTPGEAVGTIARYLGLLRGGGRVIVFCPQESGYASDPTHVTFLDVPALRRIFEEISLRVETSYSFPFPRVIGRWFRYNEFVITARKGA
jgi:SAM-dependent methyltransferase